jgi:hypothetical protein
LVGTIAHEPAPADWRRLLARAAIDLQVDRAEDLAGAAANGVKRSIPTDRLASPG